MQANTMNHDQTAPVNIVCNIMYKFIRLGRGTQLLSQMAGKWLNMFPCSTLSTLKTIVIRDQI